MQLLPERRQHLRIITLKNAAWLLGGLIALFVAFSTWNELRPRDPARERLYERGSAGTTPVPKPRQAEVIEERPIDDRTSTFGGSAYPLTPAPPLPPLPPPAAPVATTGERARRLTLKQARQRGERIVITGGAEGVSVGAKPAPATTTEPEVPPDPPVSPDSPPAL